MRVTEPLQYLPHLGLSPLHIVECAMGGCKNTFLTVNGVAFEGRAGSEGEVHIFLFCSYDCYLNSFPVHACPRC